MYRHYEVLGVSRRASDEEVKRAYRELLKQHHPDLGGSREQFIRIREAYETITGERAPDDHETDGGSTTSSESGYGPNPFAAAASLGGPSIRGKYLAVYLVAFVPDVDLGTLVEDVSTLSANRTVACFRMQNMSPRDLVWRGTADTTFIGDDGFMYQASDILERHDESLPQQWRAGPVEIAPGERASGVVVTQELPQDVSVDRLVYTQHVYPEARASASGDGFETAHGFDADEGETVSVGGRAGHDGTATGNRRDSSHRPGVDLDPEETERYLFNVTDEVRSAVGSLPPAFE